MSEKYIKKHLGFLRGVSDDIRLVQLCTSRDVRVNHQKVQPFLTVLLVDSGEQHAAGFKTHHEAGRRAGDRYTGLADQLLRAVESVNAR